jgi:hypothetical protein
MTLNTAPNFANADLFYQKLIDMHQDRSEEQSLLINSKLILLLANHIGDIGVLEEAMRIARGDA